ncbi:MAG: hypothetical protein R3F59_19370 [Myxococcota bacterium]
MRTSTVFVGLLGGLLFTAALVPPLYVALPERFVSGWYDASSQVALAGLAVGLAVLALTGFVAAWMQPDDGVRTGTIAGLLASLVGGTLLALPASAIEACFSVLPVSVSAAADPEVVKQHVVDALIRGTWVPCAVGIALLVGGPALGAMGGVLFDLWRGTVSRTTRTIHLSWVPQIGLWCCTAAVVGASIWAGHLDKTALPLLQGGATWSQRNALSAPLAVAAALSGPLVVWAMRDTLLLLRDRRRLTGVFWGGTALLAPLVGLGAASALNTSGMLTLWPWMFGATLVTGVLAGAWDGANSELTFDPLPRLLGEILGEAVLVGLLGASILAFVAVGPSAGTWAIAFPYVIAVLEHAPRLEAAPEALVSSLFLTHWLAALSSLALGALYGAVAVPLWMLSRITRR